MIRTKIVFKLKFNLKPNNIWIEMSFLCMNTGISQIAPHNILIFLTLKLKTKHQFTGF